MKRLEAPFRLEVQPNNLGMFREEPVSYLDEISATAHLERGDVLV